MASLAAAGSNAIDAHAAKADDQHQSTITGLADLERTLLEKIESNATHHNELSATVAGNHKHSVELTTNLEAMTAEQSSEEVRRVDSTLSNIGEQIRALEKLSTEKTEAVGKELATYRRENGVVCEEAAGSVLQIDSRLTEKIDFHSVILTELRSEIIAAVGELTTRSDANDQEHSDALGRLKDYVQESVQSLQDQCAGTFQNHEFCIQNDELCIKNDEFCI